MAALPVRKIWGIGAVTEQKLQQRGITTCGELQRFSRLELQDFFGKFGAELFELCRGIDERPVEPQRERKSLSTEETFATNLETLAACEEKLEELFAEMMADLAQKEATRTVTKIFRETEVRRFHPHDGGASGPRAVVRRISQLAGGSVCPHRQKRAADGRRCAIRASGVARAGAVAAPVAGVGDSGRVDCKTAAEPPASATPTADGKDRRR